MKMVTKTNRAMLWLAVLLPFIAPLNVGVVELALFTAGLVAYPMDLGETEETLYTGEMYNRSWLYRIFIIQGVQVLGFGWEVGRVIYPHNILLARILSISPLLLVIGQMLLVAYLIYTNRKR